MPVATIPPDGSDDATRGGFSHSEGLNVLGLEAGSSNWDDRQLE
jgi:hypothetical protein